jgi:hypothetical protein
VRSIWPFPSVMPANDEFLPSPVCAPCQPGTPVAFGATGGAYASDLVSEIGWRGGCEFLAVTGFRHFAKMCGHLSARMDPPIAMKI